MLWSNSLKWLSILGVIVFIVVFIMGILIGLKYSSQETISMQQLSVKNMDLFKIAVKWIKSSGKITDYVKEHGYKRVGIYGMSYLGDCLVDTLYKGKIEIVYGIDRNAEKIYNPYIPVYHIEDELPDVDLIIVTAIASYPQIKHELEMKMKGIADIVSLEYILYV